MRLIIRVDSACDCWSRIFVSVANGVLVKLCNLDDTVGLSVWNFDLLFLTPFVNPLECTHCPTGFWLALLFPSWIQVQFILLDPLTDHSSVPHELSIQTLKRCECLVSWVWADSFFFWVGSSDIVNPINLRGKFRLGLYMHNGLPKMKLTQCTQGGALAGFVRSPTQGPSPNPQPSI